MVIKTLEKQSGCVLAFGVWVTGKGELFALRIKNISRRRGTLGDGEL